MEKKNKIVFVFLFLLLIQNVYSQDARSRAMQFPLAPTHMFEMSFRFVVPDTESYSSPLMFVNFCYGLNSEIIPGKFSIGFLGDIGLGMDWFTLMTLFSDNSYHNTNNPFFNEPGYNDPNNNNSEYEPFSGIGLNGGIKFYANLQFGIIHLAGFVGYNVIVDASLPNFIHCPMVGVSLVVSFFGFEYAYYIPAFSPNIPFHHVSIILRLNNRMFN